MIFRGAFCVSTTVLGLSRNVCTRIWTQTIRHKDKEGADEEVKKGVLELMARSPTRCVGVNANRDSSSISL